MADDSDMRANRSVFLREATSNQWEVVHESETGIQLRRRNKMSTLVFLGGLICIPIYGLGLLIWLVNIVDAKVDHIGMLYLSS